MLLRLPRSNSRKTSVPARHETNSPVATTANLWSCSTSNGICTRAAPAAIICGGNILSAPGGDLIDGADIAASIGKSEKDEAMASCAAKGASVSVFRHA